MFFRVIVPNYNNGHIIERSLQSIMDQTFKDYEVIVVDDMSTDNSIEVIERFPVTLLRAGKKSYNGGTRNIGILHPCDSEYTLFLDSDDWFDNPEVFQTIHDALMSTCKPDCMTLSYKWIINGSEGVQELKRDNRKTLVDSVFVACWTKAIKSEKVVLFPENTLSEDVIQHIAQTDVCDSFASIILPIVNWNRNNPNSITRAENQNLKQGKWRSSMFRYTADLIDLDLKTPECIAHRDWRLNVILKDIKQGKFG